MSRSGRTKMVRAGSLWIGGGSPISVQSMTKTDTRDVEATVSQIDDLAQAGCELVRVAVPDEQAASALMSIVPRSRIPIAADIHFDHNLALMSLRAGVSKLRLNPGNIGSQAKVREVARAARDAQAPIRIGVNMGSLDRDFLTRYGRTARAMVESALAHIAVLENCGFDDIVVSLKASSVLKTLEAYRLASSSFGYPLHIGLTEAGPVEAGSIRSAVAIGTLLAEGIGDTIRVSLTGHPKEEVRVGYEILKALDLRSYGPTLISCPTCGRCTVNLGEVTQMVEAELASVKAPITVAVMGCEVNGPGEARDADVGLACGPRGGLVFKQGRVVQRVSESEMVRALIEVAQSFIADTEHNRAGE